MTIAHFQIWTQDNAHGIFDSFNTDWIPLCKPFDVWQLNDQELVFSAPFPKNKFKPQNIDVSFNIKIWNVINLILTKIATGILTSFLKQTGCFNLSWCVILLYYFIETTSLVIKGVVDRSNINFTLKLSQIWAQIN